MILFRRFPRFFGRPPSKLYPMISDEASYPDFAEDFVFLEQELMPSLRELDYEAIYRMNQHRRQGLSLMIGTTFAPVLGILQATLNKFIWLGIAQAFLTGLVATLGLRVYMVEARERYNTASLQADALRSEYFLYLGRFGAYEEDQQRQKRLIARVAEIKLKEGYDG